jgi:hypothetical protein
LYIAAAKSTSRDLLPRPKRTLMSPARRFGIASVLLVLGIAALSLLPLPTDDPLVDATLDAGHLPAFGIFALLVRRVVAHSALGQSPRWRTEILALLLTAALGLSIEALQIRGPRHADWLDFAHDINGAGAFLLLARLRTPARPLWRAAAALLALATLALSLKPLATTLGARQERNAAAPLLYRPGSGWSAALRQLRHAGYRFPASAERSQLEALRFGPQRHAAFILRRPYPDWRNYTELVLELDYPGPDSLELQLRIDDLRHDESPHDRFDRRLRLAVGPTSVHIPLDEVREAPRDREMDMGSIRSLTLFVDAGVGPRTLYLGEIRLEGPIEAQY